MPLIRLILGSMFDPSVIGSAGPSRLPALCWSCLRVGPGGSILAVMESIPVCVCRHTSGLPAAVHHQTEPTFVAQVCLDFALECPLHSVYLAVNLPKVHRAWHSRRGTLSHYARQTSHGWCLPELIWWSIGNRCSFTAPLRTGDNTQMLAGEDHKRIGVHIDTGSLSLPSPLPDLGVGVKQWREAIE